MIANLPAPSSPFHLRKAFSATLLSGLLALVLTLLATPLKAQEPETDTVALPEQLEAAATNGEGGVPGGFGGVDGEEQRQEGSGEAHIQRAKTGKWPIQKGNEHLVIELIKPHSMGDVIGGATIGDIKILPHELQFNVNSEEGSGRLILTQRSQRSEKAGFHSDTFFFKEECNGKCPQEGLDALKAAIIANDDGSFWLRTTAPTLSFLERNIIGTPSRHISLFLAHAMDGRSRTVFAILMLLFVLYRQLSEPGSRPKRSKSTGLPESATKAQSADLSGWLTALSVLALVTMGALLRYFMAVEAPMTAWPYDRLLNLTQSIWTGEWFEGHTLAHPEKSFFLTEFNHQVTYLIASLTPLIVFAHARYLLSNNRQALFATLLLVVLPMHIRFSRSDVLIIESLAMASLTFVAIYTALLDRSLLVRLGFLLIVPVLSIMTYRTRPEAFGLALVDLAGIYIVSDKGVPRRRQIVVGATVAATAAFVFFTEFIQKNQDQVSAGLSLSTVTKTIETLVSLNLNTLINPFITPPWIPILVLLGLSWLWFDGQQRRAVFLAGWLIFFLFIHSVIQGVPAMQARYHLQLVTPFVMLGGASWALVDGMKPRFRNLLLGLLLLTPLLWSGFIRDTNYFEMEEYSFLREAAQLIPDGCTVLEFSPAANLKTPDDTMASRLGRFAIQMKQADESLRYTVLQSGILLPGAEHEVPTRQALDLMQNPPSCLVLYEGVSCRSHRPLNLDEAPVCEQLRKLSPERELLSSRQIRANVYDLAFAGRMGMPPGTRLGVESGDTVDLRLYRIPKPPPRSVDVQE